MAIFNVSNFQAILFVLFIAFLIWVVIRYIPSRYPSPVETYSEEEIHAYDRYVPRYFLLAAAAVVIASVHAVIKNLPGFWLWLWKAGEGGHLFRDAANSHMFIMAGGTLFLIGLTWYVLPRFANRPLYSPLLANLSMWLITIGVAGSYLSWVALGLYEGSAVANGANYEAVKEALNLWHKLPTGASSGIMGFGFWFYVANVYITVGMSKRVPHRPLGYLMKFAVVSASAFLVGTIQGIFQVIPDNADWLEGAGNFGRYVDPISHVHMNLLSGMMVVMVAFLLYFLPRLNGRKFSEAASNRLFLLFAPAAGLFYLAFIGTGLIAGHEVNGFGGLHIAWLGPLLARYHTAILATAGSLMLVGFWAYFSYLWRGVRLREVWAGLRSGRPSAFWLVSSGILAVGTLQGLLQIIPGTANVLTALREVPAIHANLNMSGIILALLGAVILLLPELTGQVFDLKTARRSLAWIALGSLAYYVAMMATGLWRYRYLTQGLSDYESAAQMGWQAPALLTLAALPVFIGYFTFARGLGQATVAYRAGWLQETRDMARRTNGPKARRAGKHFSLQALLLIEVGFGIMGFPGMGWLFSGHALVGISLAVASPIIAYVLVPIVMTVYNIHTMSLIGPTPMVVYMVSAAVLSTIALGIYLWEPHSTSSKDYR